MPVSAPRNRRRARSELRGGATGSPRPSARVGPPAGGLVDVALAPLGPGDVPVAQAVVAGEGFAGGVLHGDDVAALDHVLEPPGGLGGDVDAAVGSVGVALGADGPGGRVHVDAGVGHLGGVLHRGAVPAFVVPEPEGGRVHQERLVLRTDPVGAVRRGPPARAAQRDRDGAQRLAVAVDGHGLGRVVHLRDDPVTDREAGGVVVATVVAAAQVHAVDVRGDADLGARLPVLGRAPPHQGVVEPVELAVHLRFRGDLDGVLRGLPILDGVRELESDGLPHADRGAGQRRQRDVGGVVRSRGLERDGGGRAVLILRHDLVGAVVAQVLGRAPGGPVPGKLGFDGVPVLIGHRDLDQFAALRRHRNRFAGIDPGGSVLHRHGRRTRLLRHRNPRGVGRSPGTPGLLDGAAGGQQRRRGQHRHQPA